MDAAKINRWIHSLKNGVNVIPGEVLERGDGMEKRTIKRWDGDNGTMYQITVYGNDGQEVYSESFKHPKAVGELKSMGLSHGDAENAVYNAMQSTRAVDF